MANPAHMTLEGTKQGTIEGECEMSGREGTILVKAFEHDVSIPRDRGTGLAAGKRVHAPLSVVKEYDKASPLLYKALCTGEQMTKVEIKWYRIAPDGTEEHYFTTELENAIIVDIQPYMAMTSDPSTEHLGHMEKVSFTYRTITWRHEIQGTTHTDDWLSPT